MYTLNHLEIKGAAFGPRLFTLGEKAKQVPPG
jgi:hypothetical protein